MAKAYNSINWENGIKEREAYVTINGEDYDVTPEQWTGSTPVDALNLSAMDKGISDSYDVKLLAVSDTAPTECETGDIYYNTTNKLLYTATGRNTWGTNGTEPLEGVLYIVFDGEKNKGNSYSWNGSDLSSVGGGSSNEVVIGSESDVTEDTKLLIEKDTVENIGSEITNEYSESTLKGYSASYVNKEFNNADKTIYANDFKCKNLFGGFTFSQTASGITFTYNSNGSITVNGTATANAYSMYSGSAIRISLQPGTYTVSGISDNVVLEVLGTNNDYLVSTTSSKTFTITQTENAFVRLLVNSGMTLNNKTFNIQLEPGYTATEYTLYKDFENDWIKVNHNDYFTKTSAISTVNSMVMYKNNNMYMFFFDCVGTFDANLTKIGTFSIYPKGTTFCGARVTDSNFKHHPASIQIATDGSFNLYAENASTRCAGTLWFIV